jgi:hypothetical protein
MVITPALSKALQEGIFYNKVKYKKRKEKNETNIQTTKIGIPDDLRGEMWQFCSGSIYKYLARTGKHLLL